MVDRVRRLNDDPWEEERTQVENLRQKLTSHFAILSSIERRLNILPGPVAAFDDGLQATDFDDIDQEHAPDLPTREPDRTQDRELAEPLPRADHEVDREADSGERERGGEAGQQRPQRRGAERTQAAGHGGAGRPSERTGAKDHPAVPDAGTDPERVPAVLPVPRRGARRAGSPARTW